MPVFNYSSLLGLMREKGFTQKSLAQEARLSLTQLSAKLNGKYQFTQRDIKNISSVLGIAPIDIGHYFFTV